MNGDGAANAEKVRVRYIKYSYIEKTNNISRLFYIFSSLIRR